jgi:ligand-binding SRPBCC domain-containing protein
MGAKELVFRSLITQRPEVLWERVTSLDGINEECSPWLALWPPRGVERLTDAPAPVGEVWFDVWMFFLRVLPFDRMRLRLTNLEERGFVEESAMWWLRQWRHARTVTPKGESCVLEDVLTFEARVPGTGWIAAAAVWFLFDHRHRRLRARQGGRAA